MRILTDMIATVVNTVTVIIGGLIGLFLKGKIAQRYQDSVSVGVGLVTLVLGMSMALSGGTILLVIPALVLGGLVGTALRVEDAILRAGDGLRKIVSPKEEGGTFARGFLDATVLFCVGPMTIVGSIEAGLQGNYDVIFTKSAMDGFMAIILAAASGAGVVVSALSVFVIQGAITLGAGALASVVTEGILAEIGALGGYLILMIALNLLNLKRVRTADFLPAIVVVVLFAWGRDLLGI